MPNKWLNMPRQHSSFNSPEWICSECGAEHTRDGNAAINLRKLGTAGAEPTRRDMTPLPAFLRMSASVADEPRTEIVPTCAHIEESRAVDQAIDALGVARAHPITSPVWKQAGRRLSLSCLAVASPSAPAELNETASEFKHSSRRWLQWPPGAL